MVLLAGVATATLVHGPARAQLGTSANVPGGPQVIRPDAAYVNPTDAPATPKLADMSDNAVQHLLEQASFWRSQYRLDQANDSLTRLLAIDSGNADGLAMLGEIQAEQGMPEAAKATLARLKSTHPEDTRIAGIERSLKAGPIDQAELSEARRLAQEGRQADALSHYQRIFKGTVPTNSLAIEYYSTLAAVEGSFDTARDAMARLVSDNPQDLRAQLALAQMETYREATRPDGIARLEGLATKLAVKQQADAALRQALQWLPDDQSSVPSLKLFLARNPGDADVARKLQAAEAPPEVVDPSAEHRAAGFKAADAGNFAEAEKQFMAALAINPKDADALGGMGVIRGRQKRTEEARKFLGQAVEIEPAWGDALKSVSQTYGGSSGRGGGSGGDNGAGAAIAAQYHRVVTLTEAGKYDEAQRLLTKLMGRKGNWGNYYQLGDIQARAGQLPAAEASFRRAGAMNPRNPAPAIGLAGVLERQGRQDEAKAILARFPNAGGSDQAGIRAAALRQQAADTANLATKTELLRQAVSAQPSNPWVRVDLARALDQQGRHADAVQVMAGVGDEASASKDSVQAALIYAEGRDDLQRASAIIDRIPAASRTAQMRDLQQRAAFRAEVTQATRAADPRGALLALAAQPDPTGARGTAIARQFVRLGDKASAREAVRLALGATPSPAPAQRLAYTNALLEAGFDRDARVVMGRVNPASLPADQRSAYNGLQNGIAIQTSDKLNQTGNQADAYDALAPRLATQPGAPDLNMALARLYQSDKKPQEALRINERVLSQKPDDLDVRRATVNAATQAGDFTTADQLLADAMRTAPNDPRTYLMSADVARARGNPGRALSDLKRARELRQQQLGTQNGATGPEPASPNRG